ncbi:MAG: nuclear transport factor 2 family protein [Rhodobacteraceae bacterium]|nr:nuclear transport factor 2 family protein [Paracoccaceae bacterium]
MTDTLALLRRWVVDYFNSHDSAAAQEFCAPDYALSIGDVVLAGRDDVWLPAVEVQMRNFPGMGMTVHQTIVGEGWAAIWFSEHGASNGKAAVWSGVGIYRSGGGVLTGCVAQEDYFTRRRQLKSGTCDPVDAPAAAPWDVVPEPTNREAEKAVLAWLHGAWPLPGDIPCDDDHITGVPLEFEVTGAEVGALHCSGEHVAFNLRQRGHYLRGLPDVADGPVEETLDVNGLVRVVDGRVVSGRVIRDRMGLWSRLRAAA